VKVQLKRLPNPKDAGFSEEAIETLERLTDPVVPLDFAAISARIDDLAKTFTLPMGDALTAMKVFAELLGELPRE